MKTTTAEWVEKAEGDYAIMERESRVRKKPSYDGICFHAQQCIEKYLKARLHEAGLVFSKTHDLRALLDLIIVEEPVWEQFRSEMVWLTNFAVHIRYPGESADLDAARKARSLCRKFRALAQRALDIEIK